MAVFLSPGVFPREIDLSVLPTGTGALIPAFIGTANKGPVNDPTFVSNSQQAIDTFGEPFPESFLMYAVLAFFEVGTRAFILRVAVACEEGQATELEDICIDVSGARTDGWGRVAVFQGIAFGEICTRVIDSDNPVEFHAESVTDIDYNDISNGTTTATLSFSGAGLSDVYAGVIDDCWTVLITGDPVGTGEVLDGATYQVIRNSDGEIVDTGTLVDAGGGISDPIDAGDGLLFSIIVSTGEIEENDTFTFCAAPNNLTFAFNVDIAEDPTAAAVSSFSFSDGDTFTDASDFADAFNAIPSVSGEGFIAIAQDDDTVCIRTRTAGESIQLVDTTVGTDIVGEIEAWALEIGQSIWINDIPRSSLQGTITDDGSGVYDITSASNRINIEIIDSDQTTELEFSVATGLDLTAESVASSVNLGGTTGGERFFNSYALTIPGGDKVVVVETSIDHRLSQLRLLANTSHIKTLRFAEVLGILFPFTAAFETFNDARVVLPDVGVLDPAVPLSCEGSGAGSDECLRDSAYFQNIVGWFVAKSPGTWIDENTLDLQTAVGSDGLGEVAGRFRIFLRTTNGVVEDTIEDVTFDIRDERYIGNVINEGSAIGGTNGNAFVQWIARPTFLENDIDDPSNFEVRVPSPINSRDFTGAANGIPLDPAFTSEIDRAIIGNPADESGMFAFQNPEVFDITLLITPGVSSGAVIGQALQLAESRGDVLYLVDPPFGLRPQQVVDWHNGMLFSDLSQAINSSFGALYFPHLKIFDQFNGTEIFIPPSGHVASVFARTAQVAETWFAPAGLRRGRLLTALDTEVDLTQGERDLLYGLGNAVNPIVNFPQDGITVFGQRTLQRTQSALDRVNVRMLLIFIRKNLVQLLRNFIFEPNDSITRSQVESIVNSFLADIQARRGLTGFNTVVDESNNTPERIDRNELHVSVFLKPTRAIEFVVLNLVILRTEQSFASEEVLAAGGVVV